MSGGRPRWRAFYGAIGELSFTGREGKSGFADGDLGKTARLLARGFAIGWREGIEGQVNQRRKKLKRPNSPIQRIWEG